MNFSPAKLRRSLSRSGADKYTVNKVMEEITHELYHGISTKEIYNRAFSLLNKSGETFASKYSLKKAIYELGPSGFPFERFIGEILKREGFETRLNSVLQGKCVLHEVDVVAHRNNKRHLIECKFHSEEERNCDVKVPLYIYSRFQDIYHSEKKSDSEKTTGWVVTNTRFTSDARDYGACMGLYLLSWDYPKQESLKKRIDDLGLYPVTASTLLSQKEKQFILDRDVVLGVQLIESPYLLEHLGISEDRRRRILKEFSKICNLKSLS